MIIGIVTRKSISEEGNKINIIYDDICKAVINNGGIPIGITLNENYKEALDICDGIIFQGGNDPEDIDYYALKYLYNIDKPVLGICLGMQEMGLLFNGKMTSVDNHKKKLNYAHSVKINKTSKLYNILKSDFIKVNSRHKDRLISTDLDIAGISNDGVIEGVEAKEKRFFVGVQWHPENMISYDDKQNNIFKYFINSIKKFH